MMIIQLKNSFVNEKRIKCLPILMTPAVFKIRISSSFLPKIRGVVLTDGISITDNCGICLKFH